MLNEEVIILERLPMRKKYLDLLHACLMSARIRCAPVTEVTDWAAPVPW